MPVKLYSPKHQTKKPNNKFVPQPSPTDSNTEPSLNIPSYKKVESTNPSATEPAREEPILTPTYRKYKRPKITSTFMQEVSHKTSQPHSLHFFNKNDFSWIFKDDFPFDRITPSNILKNIETLSSDTASDSK